MKSMSYAEIPKLEEDGQTIGIIIKRIRKGRGITLRAVEKLTGISNSYLSQLENGKILKPSYDVVMKLNKFFAGPEEKKPPTCPFCLSADIEDVSLYDAPDFTNIVFGPDLQPSKLRFTAMCCNNCGILFRTKHLQP